MNNRTSSRASGFTLIEIMLVVVIIMIITSISMPLLKSTFKSTQMTDTVRSAVKISHFAKSLSILRNRTCTLKFCSNQLTLLCGNKKESSYNLPNSIKINEIKDLATEEQVKLNQESGYKINYYPNGMNDGFEIFIEDNDSRRTIICHPYTGKTVVKESE